MKLLVCFSFLVALTSAAPGYLGFPDLHGGPVFPAHAFPAPVLPAPILPAPTFYKTVSAPVFAPPIFKAPVIAPAPIIKTIAPVPVIKQVAPATSYATVTQFVTHSAPVVKTVVAPQPIFKSFAVAAPLSLHGYPAFHH